MRRVLAGLSCAWAVQVLAGCSPAPTAPSAAVAPVAVTPGPNLSGVWSGSARVTRCEEIRHCYVSYLGQAFPFTLYVEQRGLAVEGVLGAVGLHGTTDGRGGLVLTGSAVLATGGDPQSTSEVTSFSAELAGTTLRGAYTLRTRYSARATEAVANKITTLEYELVDVTRTAAITLPDPAGRWRGEALVRECEPAPWAHVCYPYAAGESLPFTLELAAHGASVAGHVVVGSVRIPVAGAWDGATLQLTGETAESPPTFIAEWEAVPDRFGRMHGAFSVRYGANRLLNAARYELSGVVR